MARLEWVSAYADTYGLSRNELLEFIVAERHGQVVGIAPMVSRRQFATRHLESVGVRELWEPTDLLYSDKDALVCLLSGLTRCRVPVIFERLPLHVDTFCSVKEVIGRRGLVLERPRVSSPYMVLGSDTDSLLNAGRRSDLRRARRRAEKIAPVRIEILEPRVDQLPELLDVAFKVEAAGWKGRGESALLCVGETRSFFNTFTKYAAESGILRLAFMHIGDQPAAMQIATECGGAYWLLKIGYDEQFASCSPGNILMWETLSYCIKRGLQTCEFLGSSAPWTKHWTELERPTGRVVALPVGWSPLVYLARATAERLRKKECTHEH